MVKHCSPVWCHFGHRLPTSAQLCGYSIRWEESEFTLFRVILFYLYFFSTCFTVVLLPFLIYPNLGGNIVLAGLEQLIPPNCFKINFASTLIQFIWSLAVCSLQESVASRVPKIYPPLNQDNISVFIFLFCDLVLCGPSSLHNSRISILN